ncbi:MAG TPA: DsbA family protein [Longimicrobiaceae bacterium]|nr:DsbA family protein [Longimicrobiaceae bacterium]
MKDTKETLANVLTVVLTLCAVLVTGLVVRREFFAPQPPDPGAERAVKGWEPLATGGSVLGAADAPVRIITFSDFQCPFCARVNAGIDRVRANDPRRVAVVYRHFPLEAIHPHAFAAANAAECAGAQGRFEEYHDALFAAQDSIGKRSWDRFAQEAGVPDMAEFGRCVAEDRFRARIVADQKAGEKLGVNGTPAFIFEGRMITGADAPDRLDAWVKEALARKGGTVASR